MIKKSAGFTLIEIIIVLIVLGVLASIAIPSYFSWVQRSRAALAILTMKDIANKIDACGAVNGNNFGVFPPGPGGPCKDVFGAIFNNPNYAHGYEYSGRFAYYFQELGSSFLILAEDYTNPSPGDHTYTFAYPCGTNPLISNGNIIGMCSNGPGSPKTIQGYGRFAGIS